MDDEDIKYSSFSLYDWHYGRNFGNDSEKIEWNIGGRNGFDDSYAATLAQKIFENTDIRYGDHDAVLCHAHWHELDKVA